MKLPLTTLILLGALRAFGQDAAQPYRVREAKYELKEVLTPTYKSISDTISKNPQYISKSTVTLVALYDTRWGVIRRGAKESVVATRYLDGFKIEPVRPVVTLPVDASTGKVIYSEVVQVPDVKQDELFIRAKVWFIDNFKDANSVIRTQEREAGLMIGRGWTPVRANFIGPVSNRLWYTVRLSFKDGRYKYEVYDFAEDVEPSLANPTPEPSPIETSILTQYKPQSLIGRFTQQRRENVEDTATRLTSTIKKALAQPATGDW